MPSVPEPVVPTGGAAGPAAPADGSWVGGASVTVEGGEVLGRSRAMASDISIRAVAGQEPGPVVDGVRAGLAVFHDIEAACTRFDAGSDLMRANAHCDRWWPVGERCFEAVVAAHRAYERTGGRFDPRVLSDLVGLGYDRSLPFTAGQVAVSSWGPSRRPAPPPWRPRFRGAARQVHLGGRPIDLGGIGKGLAVRWATDAVGREATGLLVEAGGDCWCGGRAAGGGVWQVGVEDPRGGADPVAVLGLSDRACATSSIRLRRWTHRGGAAHHLIDPRTGRPGGRGLLAVTVVGADPADAEVSSKVLFLAGSAHIASRAARQGLAALWVTATGSLGWSPAMQRHILWSAP